MIARALPPVVASALRPEELQRIHVELAKIAVPARPRLTKRDLLGAVAVFLLVVASTIPVVLPFLLLAGRRHCASRVERDRRRHDVCRGQRIRACCRLSASGNRRFHGAARQPAGRADDCAGRLGQFSSACAQSAHSGSVVKTMVSQRSGPSSPTASPISSRIRSHSSSLLGGQSVGTMK